MRKHDSAMRRLLYVAYCFLIKVLNCKTLNAKRVSKLHMMLQACFFQYHFVGSRN